MLGKIGKGVLVSFVVLVICGVWVLGSAAEPPALARLSGAEKERVVKLIEGAKKEGELVAYSGGWRPDVQAIMIPKFREEYGLSESDLKIKIVSARTGAIVTKITEELRAKVYKIDLVHNGTISWFNDLIKRGEIMAYDCPEYKHFSPLVADPKIAPAYPPYYLSHQMNAYSIVYNPKYIKEKITHWQDVLRPEYKGKISLGDVTKSFSYTEAYVALRKILDEDYFKKLGKQEPFLLVSASDLINKCVAGEFPIIVIGAPGTAFRANLKGAGLELVFPPAGWPAIGWPAVILAHAPHPNAGKLFMDFIHSEVGQYILQDSGYIAGREGIKSQYPVYPKPIYQIKGNIKIDWREITDDYRDQLREEFRRIMMKKN